MIRYRTLYINDNDDGENDMKTHIVTENNTLVKKNTRYVSTNSSFNQYIIDDDDFEIGDYAEIYGDFVKQIMSKTGAILGYYYKKWASSTSASGVYHQNESNNTNPNSYYYHSCYSSNLTAAGLISKILKVSQDKYVVFP